jgi:transcriptional regulator with GAF, ATPase, and Fis domain
MALEELERTRRQRDLYLRLLELGSCTELTPFLKEALSLVVEVTGATQGYLEVAGDESFAEGSSWSIAIGFTNEEVKSIRSQMSRGIVAEALATGETIVTPSALLDPRFRDRESVQAGRIEAVLCTPLGREQMHGVLYLQGRSQPGPFALEDKEGAELFARHLAPITHRLLAQQLKGTDPTQSFREKFVLDGIIGRSHVLAGLFQQLALVAPLDVSVLLTGDSGTGKSLIARAIHDNGPRRARAFIELNCAALPEPLIESELLAPRRVPIRRPCAMYQARSLPPKAGRYCSMRSAS